MTIHSKLPSKTKSVKAGRRAKRAVLAQKRTLLLETLEARTMLSVTPNLGILVLDPTGSGALTRSGNGSMVVSNGDIVIDSNNATAGKFSGSSGTVSASNVFVAGKLSNTGGGKIVGTVVAGSPALADPLALLPQPTAPQLNSKTHRSSTRRSRFHRARMSTASRSVARQPSHSFQVSITCKAAG